jgi:hypothetical protein
MGRSINVLKGFEVECDEDSEFPSSLQYWLIDGTTVTFNEYGDYHSLYDESLGAPYLCQGAMDELACIFACGDVYCNHCIITDDYMGTIVMAPHKYDDKTVEVIVYIVSDEGNIQNFVFSLDQTKLLNVKRDDHKVFVESIKVFDSSIPESRLEFGDNLDLIAMKPPKPPKKPIMSLRSLGLPPPPSLRPLSRPIVPSGSGRVLPDRRSRQDYESSHDEEMGVRVSSRGSPLARH